jgi:hypothetical protein
MTLTIVDDFTGKLLGKITGDTTAECEAKAATEYGSNDRSWTYCDLEVDENGIVNGWTPEGWKW